METELSARERVLKLFRREKIDRVPVFSGMGNVTIHGLEKHDWQFSEIHTDARKMASMAASTFQLFGFECAVLPFDVGVEAEALGAELNFYPHRTDVVYPTVSRKLAEKAKDLSIQVPADLSRAGRIPLVTKSIGLLKEEVGEEVAIGSWVLGPYTLAGQLVELSDLTKAAFKDTALVRSVLDTLAEALIEIIRIYRQAGADYISVREMGASGDILSPRMFKNLIQPPLERIFSAIESPNVLHICGDTDDIVEQMAACGADAISVEPKNHVAETRKNLGPEALILGNIDAFGVMVEGTPEDVDKAVKEAISNGVNGIWPGCDIWPTVLRENMEALMTAARKYGQLN